MANPIEGFFGRKRDLPLIEHAIEPGIIHKKGFISDFCSIRDSNFSENLISITLIGLWFIPHNEQIDPCVRVLSLITIETNLYICNVQGKVLTGVVMLMLKYSFKFIRLLDNDEEKSDKHRFEKLRVHHTADAKCNEDLRYGLVSLETRREQHGFDLGYASLSFSHADPMGISAGWETRQTKNSQLRRKLGLRLKESKKLSRHSPLAHSTYR
ncbi:hypothetical protein TNCT_486481 [Trichonephila clavata]|uniref:Uncharacterized protein n=1 Tax=Trichonephila clavata TaxID=2740835 RepID=A0A8X6F240_TRICU|nr:hypothetical protein TNCT_486481 [Trichonephila clavata]